jgi:hypothetical protein
MARDRGTDTIEYDCRSVYIMLCYAGCSHCEYDKPIGIISIQYALAIPAAMLLLMNSIICGQAYHTSKGPFSTLQSEYH